MHNDEKALVSVIVPIYNAQKDLDQCLLSIRNQTYENLEIICINDGSTDDSPSIMKRHAAEDPRVRVIDKENGGYGAGCNRGIDQARGEWVSIIEPDDWIEPGMYADMLAFAAQFNQQIDVIKTPWWNINDWDRPESEQSRTICPLMHRIPRSTRPFKLGEHTVLIEHHPGIWSAIYRKGFLESKGIRFPEYPGAGWADNPFLIDTLCQAESIIYLDQPYYCYRADLPGSTRNHATDVAVRLPFERWLDMTRRLSELGIEDEGILESHYVRGFLYVNGAMYDDGWDNPLVREGTRQVFSSMDERIVLNSIKISPKQKRLFCDVRGIDYRPSHSLARAAYFARESWLRLRALGLRGMTKRLRFKLTGKR